MPANLGLMRVVTFNIHHGTVGAGDVVDPDRLGEVCAGFQADVLALQEVDRFARRSRHLDLAAVVAAATGMDVVFGRSQRLDGSGEYGNALLARGSLHEVRTWLLPRPLLQRSRERRSAISACVRVAGGEVTVVATHLGVKADEQDRQLDAVLRATTSRPLPQVVLGDWNARPELVEAPMLAAGLHLADPSLPTFPAHRPRSRIDHVAVRGLEVVAVAAPPTPMSDHRPLVVDLAWPTTATVEAPSR